MTAAESDADKQAKPSGSFLRELRRRKVVRTLILYIVLCWGALQVGDILFPAMGLDSDEASRNFLYLAILGFPVTFALAWFLQITPSGIVLTSSFVERRILANIPPINERRRDGVSNYFRKGELPREFSWSLVAETGPLTGLSFGVDEPIVLGRSLDSDIAVVSPHVSRQHARLEVSEDQLFVEDLGSSNGTVVNGRAIDGRQALRNEDELRFHDIIFRVSESFSRPRSESDAMNQTTFIQAVDLEKDLQKHRSK
jgi:hypothetical protein